MKYVLEWFHGVVARFPKMTLLLLGLSTLFLGYGATQLRIANDPQEFLPDHPLAQASKRIEAEFGATSFAQTLYVYFVPKVSQQIESAQAVREMEAVLTILRSMPEIQEASGVPDYVKAYRRELHGGNAAYAQLLPEKSLDEFGYSLDDLVRLTLQRMALAKRFVSSRGTALVTATIRRDANIIAVAREAQVKLSGLTGKTLSTEFALFSYGSILNLFNATTQKDIRRFLPLITALALLVLAWIFRYTDLISLGTIGGLWLAIIGISFFDSIAIVIILLLGLVALILASFRRLSDLYLTLGTVLLAGIWTFGLLGFSGLPFNFLMLAVIPLLLGVGIDYPVYLLYRYEEERQGGLAGTEAIKKAFMHVGSALVLTSLASIVGFSSLLGIDSPPVWAFGLLSNFAVISSFLVTFLFVPSVKQVLREPQRAKESFRQNQFGNFLARSAKWMNRKAVASLMLVLLIVIGAYLYWAGNSLKTAAYDPRRLLPAQEPLVQLYDRINEEFHTYDEVQILIEGDVTKRDAMRSMRKEIPEELSGSFYTQKLTSVAQFIDDLRASNTRFDQEFSSKIDFAQADPLTEAYQWALDYIFARPELRHEVESLVQTDNAGRYSALLMRVNTLRLPDQAHVHQVTQDITNRLSRVENQLKQTDLKMTTTGSPFLQELSLSILHESLFRSLGVSLFLCALLLMLALRSWVWGLVCMAPVALTAWLVIGTIRWLGLELSVATAMVTAISIGLGVGYAIHWIQRYREAQDPVITTARTGEALLGDFVTTWVAFVSLIVGNIAWNRDFGLLAAIAMTYAFGLTIFVFPALVSLFGERLKDSKKG